MQPLYKNVGECIETQRKDFKIQTNQYLPTGEVPVIDQGADYIAGYIDDPAKAYLGPLPVIVFGDHTCCLKYVSNRFAVGADGTQLIRPKSDFDVRYFYYALWNQKLEHFGYQRHFKLLKTKNIPWFPLPTQRKIAAILSAYDDLIEINLRRIKILEEMAQNLYREWFIKFRFPGHQNVRFIDSPLGRIPEGWEVKALGSLISEHIGGGWGNDIEDNKHAEPAWVIRGTDIPDARSCNISKVPFRYHAKSNLKPRLLMPGDIVFEVSGGSKGQPLGRSLYISSELLAAFKGDFVICASFCKRIRPDSQQYASELLFLSFLDAYVSGEIEQYQVQSTGISNFKWSDYLEKANRCVPPIKLQNYFCELCVPLFSEIAFLGRKNATLRRTRDLLLPRLISGEVDVSELDIAVPEENYK